MIQISFLNFKECVISIVNHKNSPYGVNAIINELPLVAGTATIAITILKTNIAVAIAPAVFIVVLAIFFSALGRLGALPLPPHVFPFAPTFTYPVPFLF